jgi:hypothetical protein
MDLAGGPRAGTPLTPLTRPRTCLLLAYYYYYYIEGPKPVESRIHLADHVRSDRTGGLDIL